MNFNRDTWCYWEETVTYPLLLPWVGRYTYRYLKLKCHLLLALLKGFWLGYYLYYSEYFRSLFSNRYIGVTVNTCSSGSFCYKTTDSTEWVCMRKEWRSLPPEARIREMGPEFFSEIEIAYVFLFQLFVYRKSDCRNS